MMIMMVMRLKVLGKLGPGAEFVTFSWRTVLEFAGGIGICNLRLHLNVWFDVY